MCRKHVYSNMQICDKAVRGAISSKRRRKRSGIRRGEGSEGRTWEGERGSTSQERPRYRQTRSGQQAHICPAHNCHSQEPPVVERTTHARATRHAANRHGTRAALPTGLMSEHPAVFHVWHTLSECTRISS